MFFLKFNVIPSVGKKTMCALALFVLCGWLFFSACLQRLTIWPVRDCGRFPIRLNEKLKRATNLRIPLKPLLAILCVVCCLISFLS